MAGFNCLCCEPGFDRVGSEISAEVMKYLGKSKSTLSFLEEDDASEASVDEGVGSTKATEGVGLSQMIYSCFPSTNTTTTSWTHPKGTPLCKCPGGTGQAKADGCGDDGHNCKSCKPGKLLQPHKPVKNHSHSKIFLTFSLKCEPDPQTDDNGNPKKPNPDGTKTCSCENGEPQPTTVGCGPDGENTQTVSVR